MGDFLRSDSALAARPSPLEWSRRRHTALVLACVLYALAAVVVAWTRCAVDYPDYLLGARGFLDGADVYAWRGKEFKAAAAAMGIECHAWPYRYPPLTAMIVVPLLPLPYGWGLLIWSLLNGLAVVATGRVLGSLAGDEETRFAVELGTWLFCPFWTSLYAGQVNPIVTLAAALAVVAACRGRDALGGLLLGLSLLLKPLAVGVAAYAAWRARWKMLVAVALVAVTTLATARLWFGPNALRFVGHQVQWSSRILPPSQNLPSSASRWLTANKIGPAVLDAPVLATVVGAAAALALVGATLLLCRPRGARTWSQAQIALVIAAVVIANGRTWYHHYTMMAIPLAVLAAHSRARPRLWWSGLVAAYVLINSFGFTWHQLVSVPKLLDAATAGGLLVWGMCALLCRQEAADRSTEFRSLATSLPRPASDAR